MCIRDRYQRRVHGDKKDKENKKQYRQTSHLHIHTMYYEQPSANRIPIVVPQSHLSVLPYGINNEPLIQAPVPQTAILLQDAQYNRDSACGRVILAILSVFATFSLISQVFYLKHNPFPANIQECHLLMGGFHTGVPGTFFFLLALLFHLSGIRKQSTNRISFSINAYIITIVINVVGTFFLLGGFYQCDLIPRKYIRTPIPVYYALAMVASSTITILIFVSYAKRYLIRIAEIKTVKILHGLDAQGEK
eukprot:TRINITY_DN1855_c0_g1_i3.p2 TRINITY_DN1855_c0_g1~~TRINITY_DN1855_c0_g1_i3.p2  ORF type:complete len:249 (-),score=73.60 TRINITY_DN1855_c0_g1_i3:1023-1769(-)